jgi:hypothetical protein
VSFDRIDGMDGISNPENPVDLVRKENPIPHFRPV